MKYSKIRTKYSKIRIKYNKNSKKNKIFEIFINFQNKIDLTFKNILINNITNNGQANLTAIRIYSVFSKVL